MNAQAVTTTEQEAIAQITGILFDITIEMAEAQAEAYTEVIEEIGVMVTVTAIAGQPSEFIMIADDDAFYTTSLQDAGFALFNAINY